MRLSRTLLLLFAIFLVVYVSFLAGPFAGLLVIVIITVTLAFILTREERAARRKFQRWKSLSLRKFTGLLCIVAILAILYSPSAFQLPVQAGKTVTAEGPALQTISPFINYLRSNYRVVIVNSTEALLAQMNGTGNMTYLMIGPDKGHGLSSGEARVISNRYLNGTLSLLMAEGNSTNNSFLSYLFHIKVPGDVIRDLTSPFLDDRVFTAPVGLGQDNLTAVFDIASPIILQNQSGVIPFAQSSPNSTEISNDPSVRANETRGQRTVAVSNVMHGSRAIIVSDSAPFSTAYNVKIPRFGVDEEAFVKSMMNWLTVSDKNTTIVLDNIHYRTLAINVPGSANSSLPIGRLFAAALSYWISSTNSIYSGLIKSTGVFAILIVLLTTWSIYGVLVNKYSGENRGKDDKPLPRIERNILAESREKVNFRATIRTSGFYASTLQQLNGVLGQVLTREFDLDTSSITVDRLVPSLGEKQAREAVRIFTRLANIAEHEEGKRRFLFPPIIRWKRTTKVLTGEVEEILNALGLTMLVATDKKQLNFMLRRGQTR